MQARKRTALLFLLSALAACQQHWAGELPIKHFFQKYDIDHVRLSPDGKCLAFLAPQKGYLRLGTIDLENKDLKRVAFSPDCDIYDFVWAKNTRLIFWIGMDGFESGGLYAVNRDGTRPRTLEVQGSGAISILDALPDDEDEILVRTFHFGAENTERDVRVRYPHVARMNIYSGETIREVTNPGLAGEYFADPNGVVRLCVELQGSKLRLLHRARPGDPWNVMTEHDILEGGMSPLGFGDDPGTLYVFSNADRETYGLYTYDLASRRIKDLVFAHETADVNDGVFDRRKKTLVGVSYTTDSSHVHWIDARARRLQASVNAVLTNAPNLLVSFDDDWTKAVVFSSSDRWPGSYYLFDTARKKFEKVGDRAPWMKCEEMAEVKSISYKARDGLLIHGYLAIPNGSSGKNLPLVVNPHGGPFLRDTWEFDREVQFLANRGYAVLRVNFRGSTGYGKSFEKAGHRQWGLKMQDDITDGVQWAIAQGLADPKRIAIYGASYGGYAALAGLAFTPELYRCGISYCGVTDLYTWLKNKLFATTRTRGEINRSLIGDPDKDRAWLETVSPINQVEKIKAPILLAYGGLDSTVSVEQGKRLARELKQHGKKYELIIKNDEGHGFHQLENQLEFYGKMEAFLKANMQ